MLFVFLWLRLRLGIDGLLGWHTLNLLFGLFLDGLLYYYRLFRNLRPSVALCFLAQLRRLRLVWLFVVMFFCYVCRCACACIAFRLFLFGASVPAYEQSQQQEYCRYCRALAAVAFLVVSHRLRLKR